LADYSFLNRVLHQLALGSTPIAELTFDLEKQFAPSCTHRQCAVYVTGLARAGTTVLMRSLHDSGQFASLTYDDMPFLLAPNLWAKLSGMDKKQRAMQERAHGDGVQVDFDSPEALEEVFWRVHCGDDYIRPAFLQPHTPCAQTLAQLKRYQDLVCQRHGRLQYLAKNNNLILRLATMAAQQRDTTFLVVFRDPLAQARSLLQQHSRFADADAFTRKYMTWLAHHEFGATHRPFRFSNDDPLVRGEPEQLAYWVERWCDAYTYFLAVLRQGHANVVAVSYERLCNQPGCWIGLQRRLGLVVRASPFRALSSGDSHEAQELPALLKNQARQLYQSLDDSAAAALAN
jgi:hypothetical protein